MDYDLGEEAAALRHQLRDLIGEHVPPDYLGAFTIGRPGLSGLFDAVAG